MEYIVYNMSSPVPGFRFHPTDEELLRYYLRRKICAKPLLFDGINQIDIYKAEPWDLPGMSKLKTKDHEWYFFSVLDKKCGKGCRTNRATDRGYWKTTGNDRAVCTKKKDRSAVKGESIVIGMKKTLVYHYGRAPHGKRTDWVMHEYRLIDEELGKAGYVQVKDAYVLCRVFQKSGSGPKNGERYGATLDEDEWEEKDFDLVHRGEDVNEVKVGNDDDLNWNFPEQIHGAEILPDNLAIPLKSCSGQTNEFPWESIDSIDNSQKLCSSNNYDFCKHQQSNNNFQMIIAGSEASGYEKNQQEEDKQHFGLPIQEYDQSRHQYVVHEPSWAVTPNGAECLFDEQYLDALGNPQFGNAASLEADVSNPIDAFTSSSEDDCQAYFDPNVDISECLTFDTPTFEEIHNLLSGEAYFPQDGEREIKPVFPCEPTVGLNGFDDASSKKTTTNYGRGFQYPFIKKASRMLGDIPAPPAFALEFPSKLPQTSSIVQVPKDTRNSSCLVGHGTNWFTKKHGLYNVIVSFGLSRGEEDNSTTLKSVVKIVPRKTTASGLIKSWLWFLLFWVLILSISFKTRTLINAA